MKETTYVNSIEWTDVLMPSKEDIQKLVTEYSLNLEIGEELIFSTQDDCIKTYKNQNLILLILHFPRVGARRNSTGEIDFILSKNSLLTVRYEDNEGIYKLKKLLEADNISGDDFTKSINSNVELFLFILEKLYISVEDHLRNIRDEVESLDDGVRNAKNEKEKRNEAVRGVERIGTIIKDILKIKERIKNHEEPLDILNNIASIPDSKILSIKRKREEVLRIVDYSQKLIESLYNVQTSLVQTTQGEIIKLTGLFTIFVLPVTIFIALFELASSGGVFGAKPFVIFLIIIIALFIFIGVNKIKKWL